MFQELINKSSILVGGSGSGKTTVIKHIMYEISDKMTYIFLVTCNRISAQSFDGLIPWQIKDDKGKILRCVRYIDPSADKRDEDHITADMNEIITIASDQTEIYKKIHDEQYTRKIHKIIKKYTGILYENPKLYVSDKSIILMHLHKHKLNSDAQEAIKYMTYIDFIPNIMIIFDDVLPILKYLTKTLMKLFVEGRHYNITTIISTQNYTRMCNIIRQNASVTIFTQEKYVEHYLNENKNIYSKEDKGQIQMFKSEVFNRDQDDSDNDEEEGRFVIACDEFGVIQSEHVHNFVKLNIKQYTNKQIRKKLHIAMKYLLYYENKQKQNKKI